MLLKFENGFWVLVEIESYPKNDSHTNFGKNFPQNFSWMICQSCPIVLSEIKGREYHQVY
jgi:hypothetical protein